MILSRRKKNPARSGWPSTERFERLGGKVKQGEDHLHLSPQMGRRGKRSGRGGLWNMPGANKSILSREKILDILRKVSKKRK